MAINGYMREGNTNDSNGMDCLINQLLGIVPARRIGMLREDYDSYNEVVIFDLENKVISNIIRNRMTKRLLSTMLR